jgi:hypothetical protein
MVVCSFFSFLGAILPPNKHKHYQEHLYNLYTLPPKSSRGNSSSVVFSLIFIIFGNLNHDTLLEQQASLVGPFLLHFFISIFQVQKEK